MYSSKKEIRIHAICANRYLIRKKIISEYPHAITVLGDKIEEFIQKASEKSYRDYGYGVSDYEDLLERWLRKLSGVVNSRMYNTNVKQWIKIRASVLKRDSYTCSYCNTQGGILECDHIIPFSKGGSNDMSNLTTACRRCNRQKRDKSVEEFLSWRARL